MWVKKGTAAGQQEAEPARIAGVRGGIRIFDFLIFNLNEFLTVRRDVGGDLIVARRHWTLALYAKWTILALF